jgi:uncharacterized iron-regulated protein
LELLARAPEDKIIVVAGVFGSEKDVRSSSNLRK